MSFVAIPSATARAATLGRRKTRALLRTVTGGAALLVGILSTAPAAAYRTGGDTGELAGTERVRWYSSAVPLVFNDRTLPPGMTIEGARSAFAASAKTWGDLSCSSVAPLQDGGASSAPAAPGDGVNTVQFITRGWRSRGFGADAAGVTDVQYQRDIDGKWVIVEADVYLNAETFQWALSTSAAPARDLETVLTHELGHVLGLVHPCEPGGTGGAPDCASDPAFRETTMFPLYTVGQASLSSDDEAGACFLYTEPPCGGQCGAGETCTANGCRILCGTEICDLGETCGENGCVSPQCPPEICPSACTTDTDCGPNQRCSGAICVNGSGAAGDACLTNQDCASASCIEGSCARRCASDTDCPGTARCDTESGLCAGSVLGATCDSADDCFSGVCLAIEGRGPICSRSCAGPAAGSCPSDYACRDVQAAPVCFPNDAIVTTESCAVRPGPVSWNAPLVMVAATLACTALGRRRRKGRC